MTNTDPQDTDTEPEPELTADEKLTLTAVFAALTGVTRSPIAYPLKGIRA